MGALLVDSAELAEQACAVEYMGAWTRGLDDVCVFLLVFVSVHGVFVIVMLTEADLADGADSFCGRWNGRTAALIGIRSWRGGTNKLVSYGR